MNIHLFCLEMRIRDENKELTIRQKALEMVVKEGFEGFSMQKLAKAAAVSPATLYIYFKNKEDLLLQLSIEESTKMLNATLENFSPEMSFSEGLTIQWLNRAKYCMKYPQQMYFLEQIKHSPLQEKDHQMIADGFKKTMSEFVHNAIARKELVSVPLEVYWSVAFAPLYTLVKFHMAGQSVGGRKFVLTDEMMMQTLQLVLKALKP